MADNNDYLKFDAQSVLDFLNNKISEDGTYTDQIYAGSNLTVVLETLSAMFEILTYNMNFQASEATFNGVQIYENMLKIVNMLGYKARASIPATIHGTLSGGVYIDKVMPKITTTMNTVGELVEQIQIAVTTISNPKVISRDLVFTIPSTSAPYSLLENTQVYPSFTNLSPTNVFYWTTQAYTNIQTAILSYLRTLWNLPDLELTTTIDELMEMASVDNKTALIENYATYSTATPMLDCDFRVSSSDIDNFVIATNGKWNSYYVTGATTGEQNEVFNVTALNVSSLNVSDGTIYAVVYNPNTITTDGVQIYKAVSSLRNYSSTDRVFEYYVDVNRSITLRFGDGIYGARLPEKSSIVLFFIVNNGTAGEASRSVFTDGNAAVTVGSVLTRNPDPNTNSSVINEKFIYDGVDTTDIDKLNCNIASKIISSANDSDAYVPKIELYFYPITDSSKFQPIETVEQIRETAPSYNRTNDRIITKGDLEAFIKRDYAQYIYGVNIMNNFEYMSKFYNWLYQYDALSKDVVSSGYKFSDSCDFNNVYIWAKGYTTYPINDFIKKTIERSLRSKKILTSELVFVDPVLTYFYPYVGNIEDDIDWLLYAREKYLFLTREKNDTDKFYKKWKTIGDLFDEVNGEIQRIPTKRMISYLFSGESTEVKVGINAYRDVGVNENASTISNNIVNAINSAFELENNNLGQAIQLSKVNETIAEISGVRKVTTTKSRNVNLYTETGALIKDIKVVYTKDSGSNISSSVVFGSNMDYPENPDTSYIEFTYDTSAFVNAGLTGYNTVFKLMQLSTGIEYVLNPEVVDGDPATDSEVVYKLVFGNDTLEETTTDKGKHLFAKDHPSTSSNSYAIYAEITRSNPLISGQTLTTYTNKLKYTTVSFKYDGTTTNIKKPSIFKLDTFIDDFSNSSIDLKDSITSAGDTISSTPVWEVYDISNSLSFAKFTNSLINGKDFEWVGASYASIEDFCFPTLYKDISSLISVIDEQNTTFSINY